MTYLPTTRNVIATAAYLMVTAAHPTYTPAYRLTLALTAVGR